MNLSDLSIEGLTQLEARLTSDLEMVKRVKALVMEYQKMGVRSGGVLGSAVPGAGTGTPAGGGDVRIPSSIGPETGYGKTDDQRLTEALAATSPDGFILDDLSRATYSPQGTIDKDTIKSWVRGMVRKGKITVLQVRSGRIGSVYAAVRATGSADEV